MAKNTNGKLPEGFEIIDLSNFTMKDFREFQKAISDGINKDIGVLFQYYAGVVTAWPFSYAGDPSDPDSYDNLKPNDWKEVDTLMTDKIGGLFRR